MLWPEPDFYQVASRVLKNSRYTECKEAIEFLKVKVKVIHSLAMFAYGLCKSLHYT